MTIITPSLLEQILKEYALPVRGTHGVTHWARVLENGRRIGPASGADMLVVELFAVFHDSRRMNEAVDHGHGTRGSELAREYRGRYYDLDDARFALLEEACAHHTGGRCGEDVTIQVCWDSDRLDLLRVGILPKPNWLCTQAARSSKTLDWANQRAASRAVPLQILEEWGLDAEEFKR
jgi:uncharacterized protein